MSDPSAPAVLRAQRSRAVEVAALFIFFASGAAALLYQIVWQRLLVFFSGSDVYSSTLIVAAFMAGLGVGHLAGGHLADRCSRRASLALFAIAELAIAFFSICSRTLYYDVLYQRFGAVAIPPAAMVVILFASLLWPTFFMGMSLPLLARWFTEDIDRASSRIGALYGFNTLGAAAGALLTTWWLLPHLGLQGSLWVGALLNASCAIAVVSVMRRHRGLPESVPAETMRPEVDGGLSPRPAGRAFILWAALYALSGFLALSLEIVWFRLLGVMVKSTAFTFGTLLAVYLAGLGAGSLAGTRYARRFARPAQVFVALQAAIGLSAALLFAGIIGLADDITWFSRYFAGYEPLDVRGNIAQLRLRGIVESLSGSGSAGLPWQSLVLYVALPAALTLVPTFLMGFAFPVLQRVVQTDLGRLGRRVGALLIANIAGSVAGALLTGWVALDRLGAAATMKVLTGISVAFVVLAWWRLSRDPVPSSTRARLAGRGAAAAAVVFAVVLIVRFMPGAETLWARLHGTSASRIVFGEDATGLSVLRLEGSGAAMVFVNGLGQSAMPYGEIHTALGMLPAFIHPQPREVAIIGLGSGDTVYAVAGRPEIARITCIEIIRPQLDTLRQLASRFPYGGLLGLLKDPRIEHLAGDGRLALMRSPARFDIVEADALRPNSAYSGNLYSDGYFRLLRDRLRPGGLAVTWSPTVRVHNAFVRIFPHVLVLPGILVGSSTPIPFDRAAVLDRLADPRVRAHYARAGIDVDRIAASYLVEQWRYAPAFDRSTLVDFNTDLFPKDELYRQAGAWTPPRGE